MIIAITGPTGAIGSELVRVAVEDGHQVVAIVRPNSKKIGNLPKSENITVVESDISDYSKLEGKYQCDIFFHLAWKETYGAERDNVATQIENIQYSSDAVKLASSWGARAFIGTGSQAEFGPSNQILGSSTPCNPSSGYGIAKYAAGKLCGMQCKQLGIRFNWIRIVSVFGDNDSDYTLIMYLIRSLLSGESPQLTKCEQMWDYTYSKDAARAIYSVGLKGKDGKTYVMGSGNWRRLKDYVITLADIVNPDVPVQFGVKEYYPHQPMMLCADISELTEDTGYVPIYTFEEGIKNTMEKVRERMDQS